jgi:hypothetical protein
MWIPNILVSQREQGRGKREEGIQREREGEKSYLINNYISQPFGNYIKINVDFKHKRGEVIPFCCFLFFLFPL